MPDDAELRGWSEAIEAAGRALHELFDPLSTAQRRWRPGPGRWSIMECIDHLAVTGAGLDRYLGPALDEARRRGLRGQGPYRLGWIGGWFARAMEPQATGRTISAPGAFTPAAEADPDEVMARFDATQAALQRLLAAAQGLDLSRIKARSAASPLLRINAAAWFAATAAHERRHLAQARRVRENASFPT